MELLRIPSKMKRCGVKIKCLKCKWQVSEKCQLKKSRINSCKYKDKHRFHFVVCVPNTNSDRITQISNAKTFDEAMVEYLKFKEQLKLNSYQKLKIDMTTKPNGSFVPLITEYLDCLSGVNTFSHLIRKRSKSHISESRKVIERFCMILKRLGYNINIIQLDVIRDREIGYFHEYLTNELKLSRTSVNKHFVIMKSFVNWVIKYKMLDVKNYFSKAQLIFQKTEKTIITQKEFEDLIEATTYENGWGFHSGEKRNHFKKWLPFAFRLALHTGTRMEELVNLRWCNIIELESGVQVIKIDNLKVNRILTGYDKGEHLRYIPMTKSLLRLLIEMGYNEKKNTNQYILDTEVYLSKEYKIRFISRSFGHYIKIVSKRKIQFKDLRKTYITRLSMLLGENTKMFSGHADTEVLKNHYISSKYIVGNLKDFDVFNSEKT